MKIAVLGAGAVGSYFGGLLARSGADVTLIGRGEHVAAMQSNALVVRAADGKSEMRVTVAATDNAASVGNVDVVLFTVKSYDTEAAAAELGPLLRRSSADASATAVVSLQNGIDNEEKIAATIGWEHVVGGVAYIFAAVTEPGVVTRTGATARLVFGEFDGTLSSRVDALRDACQFASIDSATTSDIRAALWSKYGFLCAMSGLTSAARLPVGEVRSNAASRELLVAVMEEARLVAAAEGTDLGADYVEKQMSFMDALDPSGSSSLHRDMTTGHRMELEALHGELVRRAERAGVDAPASRAIYAILSPWATRNSV